MAVEYGKKKYKQRYVLHTLITAFLLCAVFLAMISNFYIIAKEDAYEDLHVQTKQIKDDISLQIISDRENLSTMANFAAKLYSDGESYDLMFDSFKSIGLIENIGILKPDNVFVTKAGSIDLNGAISFESEKQKGSYISGRVKDLTRDNYEIIRTAVPIVANGETVGILYGVIKLDKIGERYNQMAKELDAQLFVYESKSGDLVIDTVHSELGNIYFLKDRKYIDGYSYEEMASTDKGITAFRSAYKDENMHLHYSTIDDIGWMIALARYDSQVFASTTTLITILLVVFAIMMLIIGIYIMALMISERKVNSVTTSASEIRKILLETAGEQNNIAEALKQVCLFAKSRSAVFFNTDGEEHSYSHGSETVLLEDERKYVMAELFRYAAEYHKLSGLAVNILCITPDVHLLNTNEEFYNFLNKHKISEIAFSATINNANHITVLAAINPKNSVGARMLAEKISACFSMALSNRNNLSKTRLAATTDSLTGAMNRVAFKNDIREIDEQVPTNFSCLYIDVNELHHCNNKYGHAVGDEMLIYIANTLKEVFYGHKVYRMGGDEFLVFCEDTDREIIIKKIDVLNELLTHRNYHVAVGMSFRIKNTNTDEMVKEAEIRMYEAKALYYQNKQQQIYTPKEDDFVQLKTGILEIDAILSILKENYHGIYRVSLDTDKARRILMHSYLNFKENEEHFSSLFTDYVNELVDSDHHRAIMSFLNYDALKHQLAEGKTPKLTFKKINGDTVVLSVYKLGDSDEVISDTLWVFAKA